MSKCITEFMHNGSKVTFEGFANDDWIYRGVVESGTFYEIDLLQYIRFTLRRKKGVILDIGANVGNHSIYFGKYIHAKVICFEPSEEVSVVLRRNLIKNGIESYVFECALSDLEGMGVLRTPSGMDNNVGARYVEYADGTKSEFTVTQLDTIVMGGGLLCGDDEVIAIKIDIEGMEYNALKGSREFLLRHRPDIFVEILDDSRMRVVRSYLDGLGYTMLPHSYSSTPVYHFTHRDRSNVYTIIVLQIYYRIHRLNVFLRRCVNYFKRMFSIRRKM